MKTLIQLLLAFLFIFFQISCKKIKERKKTIINLSVLNSITKEGSLYSGIPFELKKITDYKNKADGNETVYEGVTDSEGKATIEFNRVINHKKVTYLLYMDYVIKGLDYYQYMSNYYRNNIAQGKINNVFFYLGERVPLTFHIKNINCSDTTDNAVFKVEKGIYTGNDQFRGVHEFNGCYEWVHNITRTEDYYPYTLTVTRNGVTTITKDTFKIEQGMDTLKWHY